MSSPARSAEWFEFYNGAFCNAVHQLLMWGYLDARPNIGPSDDEDDITGQIVECIKDRLDDPDTPQEYTQFYAVNDQDIITVCSMRLPKPEFMFEAKRLKVKGFPIGRYLGPQGIQCFIKGKYAAEYPAAGMIAYMQSHDATRWISQLTRSLAKQAKNLQVTKDLIRIHIHPHLTDELVSCHRRSGNTKILIFHIFLDCT
jgi:hypothetical protein